MNSSSEKYSAALWNCYYSGKIPVITDIKSRSPQAGDLLQGRDPVEIALGLAAAGAPALSVVTEPAYFGGSAQLLERIAKTVDLPVLRKDFITSRDQLLESVDLGASAVLLITALLQKSQLLKLVEEALALELEPLVETHNRAEIAVANELKLSIMGINNRNILELEMDNGNVSTTEKLASLAQAGVFIVSESAITSAADVERAVAVGAHGVLVGTAILEAKDPVEKYRSLAAARVDSL